MHLWSPLDVYESLWQIIRHAAHSPCYLSPSQHCIRHGAPPVASGSMNQSLLCRRHVGLFTFPNLQSRLLDGAGKRKRQRPGQSRLESNIHGIQTRRGQFTGLATRQERNPRNRSGTVRKRHLTVASATSFTDACLGQVNPGSTMLGFRIMPSSVTRCV